MKPVLWPILALVGAGCGSEAVQPAPPTPPAPPEPAECEEHELTLSDDSCVRPGVPPDGCAEGFEHDGVYGCEPILPAEPCPPGLMAVPGDEACRPVMACGEGKWGDLPVDDTTQYVDAAYASGDADGTEARPWPTIAEAVTAAVPGALVAVAAGTYTESVLINHKPVRLWGVCPEQVTVEATGDWVNVCPPTAICITGGADGTEIGGLAITGRGMGIVLVGGQGVLVDRVWVHDSRDGGIWTVGALGPCTMLLRDSLLEQNHDSGVMSMGSEIIVEGTAVRSTQPRLVDRRIGMGVSIQITCLNGDTGIECDPTARSKASLRNLLIEDNHDQGVLIAASDATVEGTVVRNTLPCAANQGNGTGIHVQVACYPTADGNVCDPETGATLALHGSLIEHSHESGLGIMGSEAIVDSTVVRSTWPRVSTQTFGVGVTIQQVCLPGPAGPVCDPETDSHAVVRHSLIQDSHEFGLAVMGSEAAVESTVVRSVWPRAEDGTYGDGVAIQRDVFAGSATLSTMLIADSPRVGLSLFGSSATLADSHIRCAPIALDGEPSGGHDFELIDGGNNSCGCPAADGLCQVLSTGLEPPQPLAAD